MAQVNIWIMVLFFLILQNRKGGGKNVKKITKIKLMVCFINKRKIIYICNVHWYISV